MTPQGPGKKRAEKKPFNKGGYKAKRISRTKNYSAQPPRADTGGIRLNKFIANAGICSRRGADELIEAGEVQVNGQTITTLGTVIQHADKVTLRGKRIEGGAPTYVLLNKPRGYITTTDDPQGRKTVMELVNHLTPERIYPVGRLDRNTSGVLLMTNDGDLANAMMHPKGNLEKIYRAELDKPLAPEDLQKILDGMELEDGPAKADEAAYLEPADRRVIGISIHIGRNRVIRRMFESLGYEVVKLDRTAFGLLTKKDLPRGKARLLSEKEVRLLRISLSKLLKGEQTPK